jgi:hypothetical protein
MNKRLLITTLGLAGITTVGAVGVKVVRADDNSFYPPIVSVLAEKFNLNEADVKTVFDEERQEKVQLRLQDREEKFDQAVADGVITEEQKQAIIKHQQEMLNEREQHRYEMDAWFEEQGIDHDALMQYQGFGGGFGPHGPR